MKELADLILLPTSSYIKSKTHMHHLQHAKMTAVDAQDAKMTAEDARMPSLEEMGQHWRG